MTDVSRRGLLAALGAGPVALKLAAEGAVPARAFVSTPSREIIRRRHFPDIALVTHDGRRVRFYSDLIKDRIVTLNFMYVRCDGVCPGITSNLVRVQRALGERVGRDIFMYSFTLKPEQDSAEDLRRYARRQRVGPGWTFLTGAPEDVERLRRSLGFVDLDPEVDKDRSQHIGNVRYGNEALEQWGAFPGLASPQFIVESILWVDRPRA